MKNELLTEALKRRKGRRKIMKDSIEEMEDDNEIEATPGLDSPDLDAKTEVILGDGPKKKDIGGSRKEAHGSTDELAPSKSEIKARGIDTEGKVGKFDDDVYDKDQAKKLKNKKPKGLYERMQALIGQARGDLSE